MKGKVISPSLPGWPRVSAGAILEQDVREEVTAYNALRRSDRELVLLDEECLRAAVERGKAVFERSEMPASLADPEEALRAVREAFSDGLVLMFVDGRRIERLEERLSLSDKSLVHYVRVTSLRSW